MEERWKCPAKRGRKVHREKARQSRQHKNDMLFAFLRAFCVAGIVVAARAAGLGGWIGAKKLPVCAPRCRERLYWAVLAFFLLLRTHQSARLRREGVFLSTALFLLSLGLTVFAVWQDQSWEGMVLLTVEQLYDSALLLRARKHAACPETSREKETLP